MTITVSPCPFCNHDDVEIGEVSISEFAVDCPECRAIGPICGDVMDAIAKWNAAPRRGNAPIPAIDIPRTPDWIADMLKRDQARAKFERECG